MSFKIKRVSILSITLRRSTRWCTIIRVSVVAEVAVGVVEAVAAEEALRLKTVMETMRRHKRSRRAKFKRNHKRMMRLAH